jgi:hypothetical protein
MNPKDFLTPQEQVDYDNAPDSPTHRTRAQNDAVYLYNRAKKFINKNWEYYDIEHKIGFKRLKRQEGGGGAGPSHHHETHEKSAIDFLEHDEQAIYRQADNDSTNWTNSERRACRLFNHAYDLKEEGHSDNYIQQRIDRYREQLEQELPSHQEDDAYKDFRHTDIENLVDKLVERYGKHDNVARLPDRDIRAFMRRDSEKMNDEELEHALEHLRDKYYRESQMLRHSVAISLRRTYHA